MYSRREYTNLYNGESQVLTYNTVKMLVTEQRSIRVKKLENYGSSLRPQYTIGVELKLRVAESPDTLHRLLTGTGLIARETIPFDVVSNFRGSADNKPYYSAHILHEGVPKRYKVEARDTGGVLRTKINYEPVVTPEELRLSHPADFPRLDITVEDWELHNYKHYFILLVVSKRYESFDIWVRRGRGEGAESGSGYTALKINLAESELREKRVPCAWYLKRLAVFKDIDLEEAVQREIEAT